MLMFRLGLSELEVELPGADIERSPLFDWNPHNMTLVGPAHA
jgi:hypothetical protein